jgi:hypothetical protein
LNKPATVLIVEPTFRLELIEQSVDGNAGGANGISHLLMCPGKFQFDR